MIWTQVSDYKPHCFSSRDPIRDEISGQLGCRVRENHMIALFLNWTTPQILRLPFHLRADMPTYFIPWGHLAKMNPASLTGYCLMLSVKSWSGVPGSGGLICIQVRAVSWCLIDPFFRYILTSKRCCELGLLWGPIKSSLKTGLKKSGSTGKVEVRQVWSFVSYGDGVWNLVFQLFFLFTMVLRVSFH